MVIKLDKVKIGGSIRHNGVIIDNVKVYDERTDIDLLVKLEQFPEHLKNSLQMVWPELAMVWESAIKRRAPTHTHDLERSIMIFIGGRNRLIFKMAEHGFYQQYGFTPHWTLWKYIRPDMEGKGRVFVGKSNIQYPPINPFAGPKTAGSTPFINLGFEDSAEEAGKIIADNIKNFTLNYFERGGAIVKRK